MKPSEICEKAAELIEVHGWIQDNAGDVETGFCAVGALRAASRQFTAAAAIAHRAAHAAVFAKVPLSPSIPAWNDEPGRTKEEVIELLRLTAKDLSNEETPDETL